MYCHDGRPAARATPDLSPSRMAVLQGGVSCSMNSAVHDPGNHLFTVNAVSRDSVLSIAAALAWMRALALHEWGHRIVLSLTGVPTIVSVSLPGASSIAAFAQAARSFAISSMALATPAQVSIRVRSLHVNTVRQS